MHLDGFYMGQWYRAAISSADETGAHLVYLDSEDTEVLQPADFDRRSWRVRDLEESEDEGESDTEWAPHQ